MRADATAIEVNPRDRSLPLDGLRAIAALAVVAYHLDLPLASGGGVGVDWFFVLSAFLITSLLRTQLDRSAGIDIRKFLRRRVTRLMPALFGMLATILLAVAIFVPELLGSALREAGASALYVSNITQFGADTSSSFSQFFLHTWTLSLEMQFYMVLPFVLVALHRRRVADVPIVIGCIVVAVVCSVVRVIGNVAFDEVPYVITLPIFDLDRFAFGVALAVILGSIGFARVRRVLTRPWIAAVALTICLIDVSLGSRWPDELAAVHNLVICAVIAVVIGHVMAVRSSPVARPLSWGPLVAIGTVSYSLYLWHYPIFVLLGDGVVIDGNTAVRTALKIILTTVATVASFWFLERPAMRSRSRMGRPVAAGRRQPLPSNPAGTA